MPTADTVIETLGLEPLPGEGGWFRETYRAAGGGIPAVALPEHGGDRCFSTQIYFLLKAGETSALHRVKSDEVFHHYLGAPVKLLQLLDDDTSNVVTLGGDLAAGQRPQVVVPAGAWQGATLADGATERDFALMGCTVAPGFEWDDFELATPEIIEHLAARWPRHAEMIRRLAPTGG